MIELLAPAGDLEKLKIALLYGADAVYIGGKEFSLRARSSNFTLDDIEEAVSYAHNVGKRVYVTTNILPHDEDLPGLDDYLKSLRNIGVDAVICASPTIIEHAISIGLEVHLSTQASTTNSKAISFWSRRGVKRIVCAREMTIPEIEKVNSESNIDLEVFIHGGMCVSYSGRCTLSNYMTDRDANRGGCAHSCRWNYQFNDNSDIFSMSSKDLNACHFVPKLIDIGVHSLKIEGRMKSVYYIATVVNTYRRLIDEYIETGEVNLDYYYKELQKAENRLTATGFLEGEPDSTAHLYNMRSEKPIQNFIGYVLDYADGYATIEERNKFQVGDKAEVFSPTEIREFVIKEIIDSNNEFIDVARHPKEVLRLKIPFEVKRHSIIRKVVK